MANQLCVAEIHSILTLHERGWSCRQIARTLGVHRETVSKYVRQARPPDGQGSVPATGGEAPIGSVRPKPATGDEAPAGSVDSKPASDGRFSVGPGPTGLPGAAGAADAMPPGRAAGSASMLCCLAGGVGAAEAAQRGDPNFAASQACSRSDCEPYRDQILMMLSHGLSAMRIYQDLAAEHAPGSSDNPDSIDNTFRNAPSYYSVRRYVKRLRGGSPLPFRRMECEPGVEAQVDFGTGAPVVQPDGRRRRTHVLRIVLSHCRKAYSEAVYRQTTEDFIRCLENAFRHFGGAPQTLVLDNLRAAVSKADWFDPEINPKVQSFCEHYGIVPLPTKPRTPRHKGKVERGIAYVKDNGLKGHVFTSLEQQNRHLLDWETTVADTRIHGTTKKQVKEVFETIERPALQPLPATPFPFFQEGQRVVNRDGHVEVAKAYYSAPPEHLGRRVWVRWNARFVRIFDGRMQPIAVHLRSEPGRFRTNDRHIVDRKISGVERGATWLLQKAERIGPHACRWAQAMVQARGVEGVRVLQGLISLAGKHPGERIDRACEIALSHSAFRLRTLRLLIQRDVSHAAKQDALPVTGATGATGGGGFIDEHPIIRSLADYGRLVHHAFQRPGSPASPDPSHQGANA